MMIKRTLDLSKILGADESAFLFGPRGVGKTKLSESFLLAWPNTLTFNLLKHDIYVRYLTNPSVFGKEVETQINETPFTSRLTVFVDEVQKIPALLDEVHFLHEKHKSRIRFLLTGSSARKLKRSGANLLAGRIWSLKLHPLTHSELALNFEKAMQYGTLPFVYLDAARPERHLKSYVETYLKEEILQEALVRKAEPFIRFLELAGQFNGEPVNYSSIGRSIRVSSHTIQEYFTMLVDTLIAHRIEPWSYSVRKQLSQSPKFYFFDLGVLNALTHSLREPPRPSTYHYGKLFETFVINEIIRANDYRELDYRLHYWRTNTGMEIDLVLSRNKHERPIAVEIKAGNLIEGKDLNGLHSFSSENDAELVCLSTVEKKYKMDSVTVYPWQEGIEHICHQ